MRSSVTQLRVHRQRATQGKTQPYSHDVPYRIFAQYRDGGATPWDILMLELDGLMIEGMTSYLDVETLFPRFGLPKQWPSCAVSLSPKPA